MSQRQSGVLLHPTSFPGVEAVGTLGKSAYEWIDFLDRSQQKLWQILPLGPTGYGNSPYQCFSAFAGNPLLIDLETLVQEGLLDKSEYEACKCHTSHRVDYDSVIQLKRDALYSAYKRFIQNDQELFEAFKLENRYWLEGYALFMALHRHFDGVSWLEWKDDIKKRKSKALKHYEKELSDSIAFESFMQYLFFKQWHELKHYANKKGVEIIGDIPIYVSLESADVWTNPKLFLLDKNYEPTHVAGVPPDYFSATGQRWGNPLFNWKRMEKEGFDWWIKRIAINLVLYDSVRIDHFRGFEAYWSIAFEEETAINGEWIKAPGKQLFKTVKKQLGELPIIAEDLGVITAEVEELREYCAFPGMKIFQFAFDSGNNNAYLPHNVVSNCVYYSGTHDNNTVLGWFYSDEGTHESKQYALKYLNTDESHLHWAVIRSVFSSVSDRAIVQLQDILGLGEDCRMNVPGTALGNWEWRYEASMLNDDVAYRLAEMTKLYGR